MYAVFHGCRERYEWRETPDQLTLIACATTLAAPWAYFKIKQGRAQDKLHERSSMVIRSLKPTTPQQHLPLQYASKEWCEKSSHSNSISVSFPHLLTLSFSHTQTVEDQEHAAKQTPVILIYHSSCLWSLHDYYGTFFFQWTSVVK